jgi:hypothetical protein
MRLAAPSSTAAATFKNPRTSSAETLARTARSRSARCRSTRRATLRPDAVGVTTNVRRSDSPTARVTRPRATSRSRMLVSVDRLCASPLCNSAMVAGPDASCARMCASPCDREPSRLARYRPIRCVARWIGGTRVSDIPRVVRVKPAVVQQALARGVEHE